MNRHLIAVELAAIFFVAATWVITYHLLTGGRWRHTQLGRHIVAFTVVIAGLSGLALARLLVGDRPWFDVAYPLGLAALLAVLVHRFHVLFTVQEFPRPSRLLAVAVAFLRRRR